MKKVHTLTIGSKKYELYFNLIDLRRIEREIGKSLISVVMAGPAADERADIDFLVAVLRYGLHDTDKYRTDDEIYDLIDGFCYDGNLDLLGATLMTALVETGFFIPRSVMTEAPAEQPSKA